MSVVASPKFQFHLLALLEVLVKVTVRLSQALDGLIVKSASGPANTTIVSRTVSVQLTVPPVIFTARIISNVPAALKVLV